MRKLLLLIVIIGAFFAYTSTLDEATKDRCERTVSEMFGKWFGAGEDDPEPIIKGDTVYGPWRVTCIIANADEDSFRIHYAMTGTDIEGGFLTIGAEGTPCHPWQSGEEYSTGRFGVYGDKFGDGYSYTISILDVKGDTELLDVIEFKVVAAYYMHAGYQEWPIDEFIDNVADDSDGGIIAYKIVASMPEELDEKYRNLSLKEISLKIEIQVAE